MKTAAETLPALMKAERKAWRSMMSAGEWTPELRASWEAAADAERAFRERACQ